MDWKFKNKTKNIKRLVLHQIHLRITARKWRALSHSWSGSEQTSELCRSAPCWRGKDRTRLLMQSTPADSGKPAVLLHTVPRLVMGHILFLGRLLGGY